MERRKIIIDTDTASDDSVAIMMALRSPNIEVVGITTVAGNVPIEMCTNNALVSVEMANTYVVNVYEGEKTPIKKELVTGQFAHGINGMGDVELPKPKHSKHDLHAVDAIIKLVGDNPNNIDLVAMGPLTNIARAIEKAPETMRKLRKLYIMGGNGFGEGNITQYAEFNYFVDPHAVKIVDKFNFKPILVPWNTCVSGTILVEEEMVDLKNLGYPALEFAMDINFGLLEFCKRELSEYRIVLADVGIIAVAISEDVVIDRIDATLHVIEEGEKEGHQFETEGNNNYDVVTKLDLSKVKSMIETLLSSEG